MSKSLTALLAVWVAAWPDARAADRLSETREMLGKWVETRQLISQTRTDWQTDKETLDQTVRLFERELATISGERAKVSTNSAQVDLERAQTLAEQQEITAALDAVKTLAPKLEEKVLALSAAFPPPLLDKISPLLKRIPSGGAETRASVLERMQNIVGIVNEVDKFNAAVTVASEIQKNPAGAEVQVETLYLGLGQAYFVDKSGEYAGVGVPTAQGWQWTTRKELAGPIQNALAIYRNAAPAVFVSLPARIQ